MLFTNQNISKKMTYLYSYFHVRFPAPSKGLFVIYGLGAVVFRAGREGGGGGKIFKTKGNGRDIFFLPFFFFNTVELRGGGGTLRIRCFNPFVEVVQMH